MSEKFKPGNPEQDKSIKAAQELQQVLESHRMLRERLESEMPVIERSVQALVKVTSDLRTADDYYNNKEGYEFHLNVSRAGFPSSPKLFIDAIASELGQEFAQASAKEKRVKVDQISDEQRQGVVDKYFYQGREIYQAAEVLGKTLLGQWFNSTNHSWEEQYGSYNCFIREEPDKEIEETIIGMLKQVNFEALEKDPTPIEYERETFVHVEPGVDTDAFGALLGDDYQDRLLAVIPADFRKGLNSLSVLGQLPQNIFSQPSAEHLHQPKAAATYNAEGKSINILADPGVVTVSSIQRDLIHESFHHVSQGKLTAEMLQAKADFLKAVAQSANHFTYYIPLMNTRFDHVSGLEEDFVETLAWLFTNPEMLKKKNPERFQVAEQICTKLFPDLDVVEEQAKITFRKKEGQERLMNNPELVRKQLELEFAGEQSVSVSCVFPTILYRAVDLVTLKGHPNEVRVRKVPSTVNKKGTFDLVSEFDKKGRLSKEYWKGYKESVFSDPEYDEQGRLLSFKSKTEQTETFFEYQDSGKLPSKATHVSKGVAIYESNFEHQGESLLETPVDLAFKLPKGKLLYKMKHGRVTSVQGQIQGKEVYRQVYSYDKQGRICKKTYVDEYDRTLLDYDYPYKEQKYAEAA